MNQQAMPQEQSEPVKCIHIYLNADGTASVAMAEEPAPTDGQPAASLDEAFEMAREMVQAPAEGDEAAAMQSAQAGYNRKAQGQMSAPNPEGLFGE